METRQLKTIQKRFKLNDVFAQGEVCPGGARSQYAIVRPSNDALNSAEMIAIIQFQHGPRDVAGSVNGVTDADLLEMVRDRFSAFQDGKLACPDNAQALMHVEAALLYLNKRVEDRHDRGVLGTAQA